MVLETPGFSEDICKGYERAVIEMLRQLSFTKSANAMKPAVVNILGLSTYHRNYIPYFGMVLDSAFVQNNQSDIFKEKLQDLLCALKLSHALEKDILDTEGELVFACGNTIAKLSLRGIASAESKHHCLQ